MAEKRAPKPPEGKAACPVCGSKVGLDREGRVQVHGTISGSCPGSALIDGMTITEMAQVAARHGHNLEEVAKKIAKRPSAWVGAVNNWLAAERQQAAVDRKVARDAAWQPNERQARVLHLLGASTRFPVDADLPMSRHLAASTQALIRRGVVSRVVAGGLVTYSVSRRAPGS